LLVLSPSAPKAVNDAYPQDPLGVTEIPAQDGILGNDVVPCGEQATVKVVTNPRHGSVDVRDDGSFAYTPGAVQKADSFQYVVICNGVVS
jgi:hypothetical protein